MMVSEELVKVGGIIREVSKDLETMLLEKNAKYGNSALDPLRIFSIVGPEEQILVRVDDKLSRICSGLRFSDESLRAIRQVVDRVLDPHDDEDALRDLTGYLVLLMVRRRMNG